MEEEIKPEEEIMDDIFADETDEIKPTDGDDSDNAELSETELARYNKLTGKNYKSLTWDEIAKKEKIADEAFRTKKVEPTGKRVETTRTDDVSEIIIEDYLDRHKELEHIIDEAKQIAKTTGRNVLKVLKEETWLTDKAKSIEAAKVRDEETKSKLNRPSNGAAPNNVDISKVKAEDVHTLPASKKAEWLREQARKERERA